MGFVRQIQTGFVSYNFLSIVIDPHRDPIPFAQSPPLSIIFIRSIFDHHGRTRWKLQGQNPLWIKKVLAAARFRLGWEAAPLRPCPLRVTSPIGSTKVQIFRGDGFGEWLRMVYLLGTFSLLNFLGPTFFCFGQCINSYKILIVLFENFGTNFSFDLNFFYKRRIL